MTGVLDIVGGLALVGGAAFLLLGGLGLNRMPDSFTRIQVGTKTTTLGTILILIGAGCLQPEMGLKLLLIAVFLLFTNPLSSQVLARAAKRIHVPEAPETEIDEYEEGHPDMQEGEQ
jgi:multicomponent Na+:H+ antiporter subunit G